MKKKVGIIKRLFCLLLIFLLSINSFAAIVSDNDGSAFITKAEFDALKSSFQSQIDSYNQSIDSKIDGAIASYLAGIKLSTQEEIVPEVPVGEQMISTTGNDYGWKEGMVEFTWKHQCGPFGDSGTKWCCMTLNEVTNALPVVAFNEINVSCDNTTGTALYKSSDKTKQIIIGTSQRYSTGGYSATVGESNTHWFFAGWRRVNPEDDTGTNFKYAGWVRNQPPIPASTTKKVAFSGNRSGVLARGVHDIGSEMSTHTTVSFTRDVQSSQKSYLVVPDSTPLVWGFYDSQRTKGFCNDSKTSSLADFNDTIGEHTKLNVSTFFKNTTLLIQSKQHDDNLWTIQPNDDFLFAEDWGISNTGWTWGDWTGSNRPEISYSDTLTPPTPGDSHDANIGYYHFPYIGCEDIKNWNKIGMDYGSNVNGKIITANNHGTLVNVNGSQYLSPVSGIPIFVATADGIAEVQIKFQKDTDHMPDTNSTYADLYLSNQPFKENDLGYNNAVIGPKTGSTARKLLSDQPAGHGSGSIKVNYDAVTTLKFEVQKDEPIFINFSAYEPSQSSYRGKCTATIQSNIVLTKEN